MLFSNVIAKINGKFKINEKEQKVGLVVEHWTLWTQRTSADVRDDR